MDLTPIEPDLDELLEDLAAHHEGLAPPRKLVLRFGWVINPNLSPQFVNKWRNRCRGMRRIDCNFKILLSELRSAADVWVSRWIFFIPYHLLIYSIIPLQREVSSISYLDPEIYCRDIAQIHGFHTLWERPRWAVGESSSSDSVRDIFYSILFTSLFHTVDLF